MSAASIGKLRAALYLAFSVFAVTAAAAPFTPGNLVVYRVGTGTGSLVATGNAVFLDEYTPAGVKIQSIPMPTAANGAQRALVASGTATTDGLLTRSADGACLVVPGYGRDLNTGTGNLATSGTTATGGAIPRVVARVTPQAVVDTSTALTDASLQSNFRGAASTDCTSIWVSGAASTGGGVRYTTLGATTSADVTGGSAANNTRAVAIHGGQLFASVAVLTFRSVARVGTGLPTSFSPAVAALPGLPLPAVNAQPYAFFLAQMNPASTGVDTLYIADEALGVLKYSLVGGTWLARGTAGAAAEVYRGITGIVNGTSVTLFATRKGGNTATGGGELVSIVDASGFNATMTAAPTLLAAAAGSTAFRGVALAPVAPPPPSFTVVPSAGAHGSINPPAPQQVFQGSTVQFTLAPDADYTGSVGGSCGGTLVGNVFTTSPVTAACTVIASFVPLPRYNITTSVSANGSVSPAGPIEIVSGHTTSFNVTPSAGYNAAVRGTCGGAFVGDTFVTRPVAGNCTISVVFAKKLVLFVGNSYTFGRIGPVMDYNTANVSDLTLAMWLLNSTNSNIDEPHPWGGIPGVFKKMTDQAGLEYDVSISARNAASLRGHYLNTNPDGWDLRGNIASQRWDTVVLQELSDGALPTGRGQNANLANFNTYVDRIEQYIHLGNSDSTVPANPHARAAAQVFLYQTWARPDMIAPNGTNINGHFYTAAEGLEAMTADLHTSYFGRAVANGNIEDVSPVGDAFLRAVTNGVAMRNPYVPEAGKVNLWYIDYFHPSKYGSYLSAAVHFATITGINPLTLGPNEQAAANLGIAPDVAVKLQRAAQAVVSPDTVKPVTVATVSEPANASGWNRGDVTVSFSATDNIALDSVRYTLSGAQAGSGVFGASGPVVISAEGVTTVTYYATDRAGNAEDARALRIAIDRTPPVIAGIPAATCNLWPPNNKMVQVATISAADGVSPLASFSVLATSSEPPTKPTEVDIAIAGSGLGARTVSLRASRDGNGSGRIYTVTATATDDAGNTAAASATCTVPRNP